MARKNRLLQNTQNRAIDVEVSAANFCYPFSSKLPLLSSKFCNGAGSYQEKDWISSSGDAQS